SAVCGGGATMTRWWMGVALTAGCLGLTTAARAQVGGSAPNPLGPARIPEPMPCAPAGEPNLIPGPISPLAAPPGPPACLSLPAGHSGAFQCENFVPDQGVYFHVGTQGLMRQRLGSLPVAVLDPINLDTGIAPRPGRPVIQTLDSVSEVQNF